MAAGTETDRYRTLDRFRSIPAAILAARRACGSGRVALEDVEGNVLTYGQLALGGAAIERLLRARFAPGERVGLLLPAAPAAAAVLLGFWRAGRVPAMVNPTVGEGPVLSALATAGCGTVLASRAFVEKGGLLDLAEAVRAAGHRLLWTEDLRAALGRFDKARGPRRRALRALRRRPRHRGGRALHLGHRGRAEGRRPHPRQHPRQRRPAPGARRRSARPTAPSRRCRSSTASA